jgi:hypothetical protein
MRIGVVEEEVVLHCLGDAARNLRSAGPVEVGHRESFVAPREGRKLRTDLLDLHGGDDTKAEACYQK